MSPRQTRAASRAAVAASLAQRLSDSPTAADTNNAAAVEQKAAPKGRSKRNDAARKAVQKPASEAAPALTQIPVTADVSAALAALPVATPAVGDKRKIESPTAESMTKDLPHGLGLVIVPKEQKYEIGEVEATEPPKKRRRGKDATTEQSSVSIVEDVVVKTEEIEEVKKLKVKKVRTMRHPYGLTPGITPFPEWQSPTPEQCQEVYDILAETHPKFNFQQPDTIPDPSLEITGCGEVPDVLDGLLRTVLSANTTRINSAYALQDLADKLGSVPKDGGFTINWENVRLATIEDVRDAIARGGMGGKKAAHMKGILDVVFEACQARNEALAAAKKRDGPEPAGVEAETEDAKNMEVVLGEYNMLSLQHLHLLSTDEAMDELLELPGIGVKTASCVLLFNLRRPSFAVDTHVHRLCGYLGWVPPNTNEVKTYMHCNVKVPDHLKYGLHQLMIAHGSDCPRCKAATRETSDGWDDGCPIEHLVTRNKATRRPSKKVFSKKGKGKKAEDGDDEFDADDIGVEPDIGAEHVDHVDKVEELIEAELKDKAEADDIKMDEI